MNYATKIRKHTSIVKFLKYFFKKLAVAIPDCLLLFKLCIWRQLPGLTVDNFNSQKVGKNDKRKTINDKRETINLYRFQIIINAIFIELFIYLLLNSIHYLSIH